MLTNRSKNAGCSKSVAVRPAGKVWHGGYRLSSKIPHFRYSQPLAVIMSRPKKCLHKNVDMLKNNQTLRRFSESIKLQVLAELSEGKFTKRELSRKYNVGPSTITDWIRKYGRSDLLNQRVNIESMDELKRIHALQKENEQLKDLLYRRDLEKIVQDSYLEVAAQQLGMKDADELKKKLAPKP